MARERTSPRIAAALLPALAAALIACDGGSSSPRGGTAPTISNLYYFPQTAAVGEGGGMVGVPFNFGVTDPDGDVVRLVVTVLDESDAQLSQVSGAIQGGSGVISGAIGGMVDIPTAAVATYAFQVQVFDAGGRGSNVLQGAFSVVAGHPLPAIATLTPASVAAESPGFTLTVTGSGFVPASVVNFGGAPLTTTYVDATTLEAWVDYYRVYYQGPVQITVTNPSPGGGTSDAATFVVEAPTPNPVPELATLSPTSVDAGGLDFTLTVTGSGFVPSSQILWTDDAYGAHWLSTTFVDATTLTVVVSSYLTSSPGTAAITVQNPAPGGGTTSALTFTVARPVQPDVRTLSVTANDLVWDPWHRKIYLALPSLSAVNPNSVTVLDPYTGELGPSVYVGSEPSRLALSDDGALLYVALRGASTVERLTVPDLARDLSIALGRDASYGAYYASDVQVAPGAPATIAVSLLTMGSSSVSGGIVVYDDGTPRPTRAASPYSYYGYDSLQWGTTAAELYAVNPGYYFDLYALAVDAAGVALESTWGNAFSSASQIRFDAGNGLVYADDGRVVDPATGTLVGTFPNTSTYYNQRRVVADSSLGTVWFASGDPYSSGTFTVGAYDLAEYHPTTSLTVKFVSGPPRRPIRWGRDGLALLAADAVILLEGPLVLPVATTPNPSPSVTSLSPPSAAPGSPNLAIVVNGAGFVRGSVVLWNGSERTTRFVSPTALVAYLPASDLAAAGSADVTVASPLPGGGTSAAAAFTVGP